MENDLKQIISISKKDLLSNKNGELRRRFRKKIEEYLVNHNKNGKRQKVFLSLLCIDKVIEKYSDFIDKDNLSKSMFDIIVKYINYGYINEKESDDLLKYCNFIFEQGSFRSDFTEYFLLYLAISRIMIDENRITTEGMIVDDSDLNIYDYETDYLCSVIYNDKNNVWESKDTKGLREFWNWYLDEAIYKAIELDMKYCKNINKIINKKEIDSIKIINVWDVIETYRKSLNTNLDNNKLKFNKDDLAGQNMPPGDLSFIQFENMTLRGVGIDCSYISNTSFNNSDLTSSALQCADFENVTFRNTNFYNCIIDACKFINCDFTNSNLEEALGLEEVEFINCIGIKNEVYKKLN